MNAYSYNYNSCFCAGAYHQFFWELFVLQLTCSVYLQRILHTFDFDRIATSHLIVTLLSKLHVFMLFMFSCFMFYCVTISAFSDQLNKLICSSGTTVEGCFVL